MKKYILIICLLCMVSLVSCSAEEDDSSKTREEYGFINGSMDYFVYDSYFFDPLTRVEDIYYQNIKNPIEGGMSIFEDPLAGADSSDNPLNISDEKFILVDAYATERNDNVPVLIIAYNPIYNWDGVTIPEEHEYNNTTIVSYNMKTHAADVIAEKLPGDMRGLSLYGDKIYFTCSDGDQGYNLYTIKLDGTGFEELKIDKESIIEVVAAKDQYLFLYISSEFKIYQYDTETGACEPIGDSLSSLAFVRDDYIYYCDEKEDIVEYEGEQISISVKVRKKLNSNEPEEIYEQMKGTFNYNNGISWRIGFGPEIYGGYVSYGNNKIYAYDWNTGTEELIADFSDRTEEATMNCMCDKSLIILLTEYKNGESTGHYKLAHIDLETKTSTIFCLIYPNPVTGNTVYEYVANYSE